MEITFGKFIVQSEIKMKDADNKITRMDIITSAILITIIVCSTLFELGKTSFKVHPIILYIGFMFTLGIPILAHSIWLDIVKNIGNQLEFTKKLLFKILSVLVYFSVVAFLWIHPSEGLSEAFIFRLNNFDWFQIGIVTIISYIATKETIFNNIFTSLIWSTAIIHLLSLYLSYGLDDGCTTIGADPLFGGGGEVECDPDYVNSADQAKEIANKNSFNKDSLFAVNFIVLCFTSYLSIVAGYLKRKFYDKTY